jgi:hypothetical protein
MVDLRRRLPAPFGRVAGAEPLPLFAADELTRFYRAVALAKTEGAFASPHGPLEVTGWLHVTVNLLESIDIAAHRATHGEVDQLRSLQTLVSAAPGTPVFDAGLQARNRREERLIRPAEPVAVAVAGVLLGRLDEDPEADWAHRTIRLYALGTRAIEQAILAARAYGRGEIGAATFEAAVEAANTYRPPADHDHDADPQRRPTEPDRPGTVPWTSRGTRARRCGGGRSWTRSRPRWVGRWPPYSRLRPGNWTCPASCVRWSRSCVECRPQWPAETSPCGSWPPLGPSWSGRGGTLPGARADRPSTGTAGANRVTPARRGDPKTAAYGRLRRSAQPRRRRTAPPPRLSKT